MCENFVSFHLNWKCFFLIKTRQKLKPVDLNFLARNGCEILYLEKSFKVISINLN